MTELIFRITSKNSSLESFFHRYTLLFNEFYRHRKNHAYFETIDRGFLYILPDLETYHRIADTIPGHEAIAKLLSANLIERNNLVHELTKIHGFSKKDQILLDIEVSPYTTSEALPVMKKAFQAINPEIAFTPVGEHNYNILFPYLDAFIDYYLVYFLSSRTPTA